MKRIAIAAVAAMVVLAAAGSAFAAVNNYKASYKFSGSKKGHLSFNQTISVSPVTAGDRTGILHQITTQISGVKVDASGFPTCTANKINSASSDSKCPKSAMVASGSIKATLGPPSNFSASQALQCDPELHVWNGGKGKLIFFFVETGSHQCLGGQLHTGQVPPWTGTYHQSGSKLDVTIPVPNTVDYPLGQSGGEVGSLSFENLHWMSKKVKGHYDILSTGCSGSKRSYSFGFKASLPTSGTEKKTVKGTANCA